MNGCNLAMWQITAERKAGYDVWVLKDPLGHEVAWADPLEKWMLEDLLKDAADICYAEETALPVAATTEH